MSVILDALKKLDREKSSRRSGTVNIAVEILKPDLAHPRKRILLYFAAVSLVTAAITYAVMVEFGFLSKPSSPAPVSPPAQSRQVAPTTPESGSPSKPSPPAPVSPPAETQQAAPAVLSREPVRDVQDKVSPEPLKIQPPAESQTPVKSEPPAKSESPAESKIPAEGHPPAKSESPATSLEKKEIVETDVASRTTKKSAEHVPRESATTPPSLKVSGIVWREEPSERLAVINGMILHEGSEIGGVKVEEIHPTRVRFSHKDRPFEISLGSSLVISE